MSKVDLALIRFDFDLTFAAVVMHADGTIYHRYGGREPEDAGAFLSLTSLAQLLRDTVAEHQAYDQHPVPKPPQPALPAIQLPVLQRKIAGGQRIDCVHCHTINDAEHVDRVLRGTWQREDLYVFPDPARIGLTLDHERQREIVAVAPDSPAAKAGVLAGDELLMLGEQHSVRTLSDVQWALHLAPFAATKLPARVLRGQREIDATVTLAAGWKRCTPEEYAWRPYKWNLSPSLGFGGPALDATAKQELGIATHPFAMRVQYLVDWGERAHRGRAAKAAGLKKGDIVVSVADKADFDSFEHLHAWVGMTMAAGQQVRIGVWRKGEITTLELKLPK